ncbi:MAG: hypothetical protein HY608_04310 [Planctomycetes bacterium]|nr:hypothetical protein [Planctomycetota bacterium]
MDAEGGEIVAARSAIRGVSCVVLWGLAMPVLAGPPLLCHRYEIGDRPSLPDPDLVDALPGPRGLDIYALFLMLSREQETLVRMETIRRAALWRVDAGALLHGLDLHGPDNTLGWSRRFNYAYARLTLAHAGLIEGDSDAMLRDLREAVEPLRDDPAAWLALARATFPLVCGDEFRREHADAFVRACDLVEAMPDTPARGRLRAAIDYDLDHLEAYLLDEGLKGKGIVPDRASRLAALREIAATGEEEE